CLGILRARLPGPIAALAFRCRIHYARDMAARAEYELLVAAKQAERTVRRTPGNDVILTRRQDERRLLDGAQVHGNAAVRQGARLPQPVFEIGVADIGAI